MTPTNLPTLPIALTISPSTIPGAPLITEVHFNRMALGRAVGSWSFFGSLPSTITIEDLESIKPDEQVDLPVTFLLKYDLPPEIDIDIEMEMEMDGGTDDQDDQDNEDDEDDDSIKMIPHEMDWVVSMTVNVATTQSKGNSMKIYGTVAVTEDIMRLVAMSNELLAHKDEDSHLTAAA